MKAGLRFIFRIQNFCVFLQIVRNNKFMAQVEPGIIAQKGSVGEIIVYERGGKHYMRSKPGKQHNPTRTAVSMSLKCKWANLVICWRRFNGALKGNFECKRDGQTDYNAFLGINLQTTKVLLSKQEREQGMALAENFAISMGTLLPVVEVHDSGTAWQSDIAIDLPAITGDTKVNELTFSLMRCNEGLFRFGDEILFTRMEQRPAIDNRNPDVLAYSNLFIVSPYDERPLREVMHCESDGKVDGFLVHEGHLAAPKRVEELHYSLENYMTNSDIPSLVAWTRRRKTGPKRYQVTSQSLVGANPIAAPYLTAEAMERAIRSYGPLKGPGSKSFSVEDGQIEVPLVRVTIQASAAQPATGWVDGGGQYSVGSQVVLRAMPSEGHRFLCWDDGLLTPERSLTATSDLTLRAIFAPEGV